MLDGLGLRSAEFSANVPDSYGRMQKAFALPKRETLILAMGYTGSLAARFKEAYIKRFNEMEQTLQ